MATAPVLSQVLAVQTVLDAVERDQVAPRAAFDQLKPGQILTGLVKSQSKGISQVEVDGQIVAMRLPISTSVGDTLRLRFSGRMPQPVFMLETSEAAISDAPLLSKTARMLSDIMQRVPDRSPPTLTPAGPLLDQPSAGPADLALALRTALVRSGLFYESHLANWVGGQDSLSGLMQEPQNRQSMAIARTADGVLMTGNQDGTDAQAVNPLHTLLTQQLQVLESPQFIWRGELWPGQTLEWHVSQDAERSAEDPTATPAGTAEAGWESRLKLSLPQLGTLDVFIKLDARKAFSIRVVPQQATTAPLLQSNQMRLVRQLAEAGCTLQSLLVDNHAVT